MDIEKLYEKYNILLEAEDKISEHIQDYLDVLDGSKNGEKEKRLSIQIISKFFKNFPTVQSKALNVILDLCEEEDTIRISSMKALPQMCNDSKQYLPKVVFILAQLLQLEDKEYKVACNSLKLIYNENPQDVIKALLQYVRGSTDIPARVKCLKYTITLGTSTTVPDVEDIMCEELKKILTDGNPEEFIEIVPYLTSSKFGKTAPGSLELLDLIYEQLDPDQEFDPLEQGTNNTDKVITCLTYAIPLFSQKNESTKFIIYVCDQVLPQWNSIATLDNGDVIQYQILRLLAETSTWCGELENASLHVVNIFDKLKTYMPPPPEEDGQTDIPNLQFSSVEALLFAFHRLARQCPDLITHDPDTLKDFRARLMYFSRGAQSCKKVLTNTLKSNVVILNQDKEKMNVAPLMLDNINTLIKDLFYKPPMYKCNVTLSFTMEKPVSKFKREVIKLNKEKSPQKRHIPITFDSSDSVVSKQSKTSRSSENVKLYTPPSGKFSNNFQNYDRLATRPRGRGGFRGSRGRNQGRNNWRN